MLHLFSLSKGLGSAFVWLLLSASHKGQGKKKREKRKKPNLILQNDHITHFHKIKSCQLSQHQCPGQPQHNSPTNTLHSTLQGELEEQLEAISTPDDSLNEWLIKFQWFSTIHCLSTSNMLSYCQNNIILSFSTSPINYIMQAFQIYILDDILLYSVLRSLRKEIGKQINTILKSILDSLPRLASLCGSEKIIAPVMKRTNK